MTQFILTIETIFLIIIMFQLLKIACYMHNCNFSKDAIMHILINFETVSLKIILISIFLGYLEISIQKNVQFSTFFLGFVALIGFFVTKKLIKKVEDSD
ncbi:MAG: hypothetical protein HFJ37_04195 [Clostridia bacterium]|nr:hypothetical protein [Clostridia bacterium]